MGVSVAHVTNPLKQGGSSIRESKYTPPKSTKTPPHSTNETTKVALHQGTKLAAIPKEIAGRTPLDIAILENTEQSHSFTFQSARALLGLAEDSMITKKPALFIASLRKIAEEDPAFGAALFGNSMKKFAKVLCSQNSVYQPVHTSIPERFDPSNLVYSITGRDINDPELISNIVREIAPNLPTDKAIRLFHWLAEYGEFKLIKTFPKVWTRAINHAENYLTITEAIKILDAQPDAPSILSPILLRLSKTTLKSILGAKGLSWLKTPKNKKEPLSEEGTAIIAQKPEGRKLLRQLNQKMQSA